MGNLREKAIEAIELLFPSGIRGRILDLPELDAYYREKHKAEPGGVWISVTDKFPAEGVICLVGTTEICYGKRFCSFRAEYYNGKWRDISGLGMNFIPTHWMPLPEPPERLELKEGV